MGECRAEIVAMMRAAAVPGLSIAVTRPDRVVYADAFGCGDLATRSAATPDTAYLWFSMSKLVTATAALRLAVEGRLDLDAPAVEFGDHLRLACPVQPTIRQLLTHTAGLANPVPIRWVHAADAPAPDPQVLLRKLLRRRRAVRYPVGGVAHYSNVGYLLAAAVIAAAAGTPFTDYVQRAVLGPTGMRTTGYALHAGATQATGYVGIPPGGGPLLGALLPSGIVGERHGRHLALRPFLVDGPGYGGIVGGVLDAALFLRMHLADGEIDGHRILAPETARGMRTVVATGRPPSRRGLVPQTRSRRRRGLCRALRRGRWILERHASLPDPRHRDRRDDQQHPDLPVPRAAPPPCPQILGTVAARRSSELCGWRATLRARFG